MEGDGLLPCQRQLRKGISIHALRVEGDRYAGIDYGVREYPISIHALRVEGDPRMIPTASGTVCISIHALRVEGDDTHFLRGDGFVLISIHALRVEGDNR